MSEYLNEIGEKAKNASVKLGVMTTEQKNKALELVAQELVNNTDLILQANEVDMQNGAANNMKAGLLDRLKLTPERILAIAEGVKEVVLLTDPVGEILNRDTRPNGMVITKKRVPFGVIAIVCEARPNVTVDAFALCFKTGNAVILKGGSAAASSNLAIAKVIRSALKKADVPVDSFCLVEDNSHETTLELMKLNKYVDLLIPRGGAGLIRSAVENSTVPIIETGTGNCHVFVDETGDVDMAVNIIINAKTQRVGVCNACESLLIHEKKAKELMGVLAERLHEKNVEMRADENLRQYSSYALEATEEDWGTEYLDYIISMKTVANVEEAIAHINRYHTGHSDCIVTEDAANAEKFLNEVDSAAVYWNVSTRFTDGFEFGFGAEIGISTQKLHARGPMGLTELTSYKYQITGNGQVRS